jgi:hypothetical protein
MRRLVPLLFLGLPLAAQTHVYWRINANSANSGVGAASLALAEIAFYDSGNTHISTAGGTAICPTLFHGPCSNAFDGDLTTYIIVDGFTFPQYVEMQFASAVNVDHIAITNAAGSTASGPANFTLDYSDNGSAWTTKFTYLLGYWPNGSQITQTFYTTGTVYRINATACGGQSTCNVGELQFFNGASQLSTSTGTVLQNGGSSDPVNAPYDNSCVTSWNSPLGFGSVGAGNPMWLGFQFPSGATITSIKIISSSNSSLSPATPTTFTFQSSTDGTTFTTVASFSATWSGTCQTQTFTLAGATALTQIGAFIVGP